MTYPRQQFISLRDSCDGCLSKTTVVLRAGNVGVIFFLIYRNSSWTDPVRFYILQIHRRSKTAVLRDRCADDDGGGGGCPVVIVIVRIERTRIIFVGGSHSGGSSVRGRASGRADTENRSLMGLAGRDTRTGTTRRRIPFFSSSSSTSPRDNFSSRTFHRRRLPHPCPPTRLYPLSSPSLPPPPRPPARHTHTPSRDGRTPFFLPEDPASIYFDPVL